MTRQQGLASIGVIWIGVHQGGFDFEIQVDLEMGADLKVCLAVIPALALLKVAATNVKRGRENRTRRRRYRTPDTNNRYLHPILMPVSCSINILSSVWVTIFLLGIYQFTTLTFTKLPLWQLPSCHSNSSSQQGGSYQFTTFTFTIWPLLHLPSYHRGIDHLSLPQRLTWRKIEKNVLSRSERSDWVDWCLDLSSNDATPDEQSQIDRCRTWLISHNL